MTRIFSHAKGYVRVRIGGKYYYEHRWVAEKMIGRQLKDGEVVHHVDGDRANNSPKNLIVMLKEDHDKLHRISKKS